MVSKLKAEDIAPSMNHNDDTRNVWIVNHYGTAPHKEGSGGRHYYLGQWLTQLGWSPTLIGSTTLHPTGRQAFKDFRPMRRARENGVNCIWVWSNSYTSGGIMRALGMVVFACGVLNPRTTRNAERPDVIIGSTVHLLASWAGLKLARRHNAHFVYEVRDLWPETLIDLGAIRPGSFMARAMKRFSLSLARSSTMVISPLPGVGNYLTENDIDTPFLWLANGTDETLVSSDQCASADDGDPFTVMYLGSHGRANALDTLLRAFDRACEISPGADLRFRLVGNGPEKPSLRVLANQLHHRDRITFEDHIPRSVVNSRAREADCLIVNLLDRPIYRYGISLNKLYDYLLAARPVVIANSALNDPIKDSGAGISVPADDIESLANAIVDMYDMGPDKRKTMGRLGKEHVLKEYTYRALALRLSRALDGIVQPRCL